MTFDLEATMEIKRFQSREELRPGTRVWYVKHNQQRNTWHYFTGTISEDLGPGKKIMVQRDIGRWLQKSPGELLPLPESWDPVSGGTFPSRLPGMPAGDLNSGVVVKPGSVVKL